jgi:hypothetical protein
MDFNIYEQDCSAGIQPAVARASRPRRGVRDARRTAAGARRYAFRRPPSRPLVMPLHQLPIGPHRIRITIFIPR